MITVAVCVLQSVRLATGCTSHTIILQHCTGCSGATQTPPCCATSAYLVAHESPLQQMPSHLLQVTNLTHSRQLSSTHPTLCLRGPTMQ